MQTTPTLSEARRLLDAKTISSVELTTFCLDEIEASEPLLQAWTQIDADAALVAAKAFDDGTAAGPLSGIPMGIKDIIDVAGFRTTASSKVLRDNLVTVDAPVVARLRGSGAVIVGKTNTHEFAYGYVSSPTANPWDISRIPGGSSGGSAAAVAAGHVVAAIGSDTGGSVRVPAALCGISGLRPRQGAIPIEGVIPLSPRLDVVGPIARTAEDLRVLFEVMAGVRLPSSESSCVVGIGDIDACGDDVEPDVAAAFADACKVFADLFPCRNVELPSFEDFQMPRAAIIMPDALAAHRARGWWPDKKELYGAETAGYLDFAENFLPPEMVEAGIQQGLQLAAQLKEAFGSVDLLLTPAVPVVAPTFADAERVEDGGLRRPIAMQLGRLPSPVNMADLAAAVVSMWFRNFRTSDRHPDHRT